jgi:hypothetical protein
MRLDEVACFPNADRFNSVAPPFDDFLFHLSFLEKRKSTGEKDALRSLANAGPILLSSSVARSGRSLPTKGEPRGDGML